MRFYQSNVSLYIHLTLSIVGRGIVHLLIAIWLSKRFHGRCPPQTDMLIAQAMQYESTQRAEPATMEVLMCPKGSLWNTRDTISGKIGAAYTDAAQETAEKMIIPEVPSMSMIFEEVTDICPEFLSCKGSPVVCGDERDYEKEDYPTHTVEYYRNRMVIKLRLLWVAGFVVKVMTCHGTLAHDTFQLIPTKIPGLPRIIPTAKSESALLNASVIGLDSMLILMPVHPSAIYRKMSMVISLGYLIHSDI